MVNVNAPPIDVYMQEMDWLNGEPVHALKHWAETPSLLVVIIEKFHRLCHTENHRVVCSPGSTNWLNFVSRRSTQTQCEHYTMQLNCVPRIALTRLELPLPSLMQLKQQRGDALFTLQTESNAIFRGTREEKKRHLCLCWFAKYRLWCSHNHTRTRFFPFSVSLHRS